MKKLKRILSMLLVVCMIFTSQAFVTFAEGMENTETIVKETTIEETTVKETTAEETTVKETEETTVETTVKETIIGENSENSVNNELISPDVDEKEESTETEYAEEPEEDEIETEIRMGELSEPEDFVAAKLGELETEVKTESEAETEVEEKLFGDPPIYTLSLKPNYPEGFSLPEGSSWYEDKSGPLNSDTDSIIIEGWNTRICVDTAGNVCNLTGYNTKADGSGTRFSYQESIFKENLEYFNLPSGSYDLVLYAMWRTSNLYTLHYNQNLPEGYSLAEGSTWGSDATLWDYVDDFVFEIYDYTGMTCEDSDGKTLALIKWNTAADGTGDDYSFGDWFTNESLFTDGELT